MRKNVNNNLGKDSNLVPRVSSSSCPPLAPGSGKMRDPGNEVAEILLYIHVSVHF